MNNRMRSRHLQLSFNVIVLTVVFAMSFAWLPTQAAALSQKSTCQIAVKAGWSPHRVQAEDTLDALAARQNVVIRDPKRVESTGLYRCGDWQQTASHMVQDASQFQIADEGRPCYRTLHQHHESCFFPDEERFELRERTDA